MGGGAAGVTGKDVRPPSRRGAVGGRGGEKKGCGLYGLCPEVHVSERFRGI